MPRRARRSLAVPVLAVLVVVALVVGIALGGHPDALPGPVRSALVGDSEAQLMGEALTEIHDGYYRDIPRGRLADAAIAGMVGSLHDRFSNYFTAAEYQRFQQITDSQFSGVGLSVSRDRRGLRIVHVFGGSPAAKGGLRAGDLVVAVDGRSLRGLPERRSSALIRGRDGTAVRLTIVSRGRRRVVRLVRSTVSVPVVESRLVRMPGGRKAAYVALASFSSGAHGEVRQAVDRLLAHGAKGIVLDLRRNGGGLVTEARLIASIFLPDGTIVSLRGRNRAPEVDTATGGAISTKIPMVVLVDGDTASASEIVAGALQDRHRAAIVGTRTFGKGVFQEVHRLPNDGALDITVGRYFTPSGHNLGGVGVSRGAGIRPDVRARDVPSTPRDEALAVALRTLAAG